MYRVRITSQKTTVVASGATCMKTPHLSSMHAEHHVSNDHLDGVDYWQSKITTENYIKEENCSSKCGETCPRRLEVMLSAVVIVLDLICIGLRCNCFAVAEYSVLALALFHFMARLKTSTIVGGLKKKRKTRAKNTNTHVSGDVSQSKILRHEYKASCCEDHSEATTAQNRFETLHSN